MASTDFNEDDFDDYNPHPYKGGYDIALTYGPPLPPSASICYPLSSSGAPSPPPPPPPTLPPPPSSPPPPSPPAVEEAPNPNPNPSSREPDDNPPYNYGQPGYGYGYDYSPEPYPPNLPGLWPFLPAELPREYAEEIGFWGQLRRAANFLFGYGQGCGERIVGSDRYGVPIYAHKSSRNQPLAVEVEAARNWRTEYYYDADVDRFGRKDESSGFGSPTYACNSHYSEPPLSVTMDPGQLALSQRLSGHYAYEEQVYPEPKLLSSSYDGREDETQLFENHQYAYNKYDYWQQPLHAHIEPNDSSWSQKPSYYEAYQEQVSSEVNWHSSHNGWEDERSSTANAQLAYERHYSEQPLRIELEPFKPTWSQNPSYYEIHEGEVPSKPNWHSVAYGELRDNHIISANPYHAEASHYSEQPQDIDLEPFKPAWSQNIRFYDGYDEEVPSSWHTSLLSEPGDGGIIGNITYAYEKHSYEQPLCVQIEDYKPTWSLNPSFYEVMGDTSPDANQTVFL